MAAQKRPAGRREARAGQAVRLPQLRLRAGQRCWRWGPSWGVSRAASPSAMGRCRAIVGFEVRHIPGGDADGGGAFRVDSRVHCGGAGGSGPDADRRPAGGGASRAGARVYSRASRVATACVIPQDLTGARVLDVGAFDGFYAFLAERRGAARVVAVDNDQYVSWVRGRFGIDLVP